MGTLTLDEVIRSGLIYKLRPASGIEGDKKWLGWELRFGLTPGVTLYEKRDVEQLWAIEKSSEKAGFYDIIPATQPSPQLLFRLSANLLTRDVDLYEHYGKNQQWRIALVPGTPYHVTISVLNDDLQTYSYLSCPRDGSNVDLYREDDGSGRQRWQLTPVNVVPDHIEWTLPEADAIPTKPVYFEPHKLDFANNSSVDQSQTFIVEQLVGNQEEFYQETCLAWNMEAEVEAGYPGIAASSVSVGVSRTRKVGFKQVSYTEDTRRWEFPVNVPPRSTVEATALIRRYPLTVSYKLFWRIVGSETLFETEGTWSGESAGEVDLNIETTDSIALEYREMLSKYRYTVKTSDRTYLANGFRAAPQPWGADILLDDAWVWDIRAPSAADRIVSSARVVALWETIYVEDRNEGSGNPSVAPHGYVGNQRSRELHRPDCVYVDRIRKDNRTEFASVDDAMGAGYDGCMYCLPESHTD